MSSSYVLTRPTLRIAAAAGLPAVVMRPGVDLARFNRSLFARNAERAVSGGCGFGAGVDRVCDVSASLKKKDTGGASCCRARFVVGFVGRLVAVKSPGLFLQAAAELLRRQGAAAEGGTDFVFEIAGEGPLERPLRRLAARLGLAAHVSWLGHRDHSQLPAVMAGWDALVFPSVMMETFGMVCIEAMAVGAVVINFGTGGTREFTSDEKTARPSTDNSAHFVMPASVTPYHTHSHCHWP